MIAAVVVVAPGISDAVIVVIGIVKRRIDVGKAMIVVVNIGTVRGAIAAAVLLETVSYAAFARIFVICIDVAGDAVCIIVRVDIVSFSVAVIGVGNAIVVAIGRTS